MVVEAADGQELTAVLPDGVRPGQVFRVAVGRDGATTSAAGAAGQGWRARGRASPSGGCTAYGSMSQSIGGRSVELVQ
jgi:hypothetical protein